MTGIQNFIRTYHNQIKTIGGMIIALVALVFIIVCIVKSMKGFGTGKMGEGVKQLMFAIIIGIVAAAGIIGMIQLINNVSQGAGAGLFNTQSIN